ncbi:FxsA family protein [Pseudonocardia spinosispora]|uniref:FxsA family protein n=1 Tax=Pseudonocardia spinosispora TaxID=103441 RepID=UPI000688713B|nr:FxsA family protein [Pseudonocardia spinosispora]
MRWFLMYAVVEVVALAAVVAWLGFGWTLLLLLAGAMLGMWLVRREGARAALATAEAVRGGRTAHAELTDGALIGVAGLLILVPGVVSDVLGLLLVLPPVRALVRGRLVRQAEQRSPLLRNVRIRTGGPVIDGTVVEGTVVDTGPKPPSPPTARRPLEG